MSALVLLTVASLVACSRGNNNEEETPKWQYDPEATYEIGDTVKEWKSTEDFETIPLDVPEGGTGTREISKEFGHEDLESLHYSVKSGEGYITSNLENKFFSDLDAKDGDIVSLYAYIPSNSNLKSLKLEAHSVEYGGGWGGNVSSYVAEGTEVVLDSSKEDKWIRLVATYETLYVLGSIRLNFVPVDASQEVEFYVDDINITYGAETQENGYESKGESLYQRELLFCHCGKRS